jgi:hypothetical protein
MAGATIDWTGTVRDFTERNAGRQARIESDDIETGVQQQATSAELRGVDYDPRDRCVEIMLGPQGAGADHVTHTVRGVESVEVARTDEGRDRALRIGHASGQVLLHLE